MPRYLTELGYVLQQLEHHCYMEHPAGSRAMMRADLEHDLARAKELRPILPAAEQARLDTEAKEVRGMLKNFELIEGALPMYWPPVNPNTLH